ncbi:hypothetical protein D5086_022116 [Populus alba]|uniref:Uncharacterized protein n=1 Tax=Populus alba TaxID=43335 RepID=A0ACC4BE32_POPAL
MTSALRFPWTQNMELLIFGIFSTFLLLSSPCHADSNSNLGSLCSEADNATNSSEYQANLSELQNSLVANAPIQNGFYTTAAGKGANKIYGLTQCRGDISATDCAACIKNVTMEWQLTMRPILKMQKWFSEGLNFTKALASTTPNQPSMFYTAVLDVGQSGKRYGMAQCTRDLSKSDCGKCLDFQLATYLNIVGNKRNWDIHGSSCSMWYYDYQFYFNYSTPAAKGGSTRSSPHRVAIGMAFPVLVFLDEKQLNQKTEDAVEIRKSSKSRSVT